MNDLVDLVLEQAGVAWPGTAWKIEDVARRLASVDPQLWSEPSAADRRAELLLAWACSLGHRDAIRHVEVRHIRDGLPNLRALDLAGSSRSSPGSIARRRRAAAPQPASDWSPAPAPSSVAPLE